MDVSRAPDQLLAILLAADLDLCLWSRTEGLLSVNPSGPVPLPSLLPSSSSKLSGAWEMLDTLVTGGTLGLAWKRTCWHC